MRQVPLKFLMLPLAHLVAIAGLLAGGNWTGIGGLVLSTLVLVFDFVEDRSGVEEVSDLDATGKVILYSTAVLQVLIVGLALYAGTAGDGFLAALGAFFTLGVSFAFTCGNVGHELSHSTKRVDHEIARMLFALCMHSAVAIDHVHNHHIHVATEADPTTARRGQPLLHFVLRSYALVNRNSWLFEKRRALKKGYPVWSVKNRFLVGHAMELGYLALVAAVFGWAGVVLALFAALFSIRSIEGFNYVAHYGLVRVPGERCEARHSWNSRKFISSSLMFNITAHSHHHQEPARPYCQLRVADNVPILPYGLAVMNLLALYPALFKRTMEPFIEHWDRTFASDAERELVGKALAHSSAGAQAISRA